MTTPKLASTPVEVVDNRTRDRFEIRLADEDATFVGFLGYTLERPGVYNLQHTIISEAFGRQGYARTLVTHVLDGMRERGEKIIPSCTYVQSYLERFPQYQDLVAAEGE